MDNATGPTVESFAKGDAVVLVRPWTDDGGWYSRPGTVISAGPQRVHFRCDVTGRPLQEALWTGHPRGLFPASVDVAATALRLARREKALALLEARAAVRRGGSQQQHWRERLSRARAMVPRYCGSWDQITLSKRRLRDPLANPV